MTLFKSKLFYTVALLYHVPNPIYILNMGSYAIYSENILRCIEVFPIENGALTVVMTISQDGESLIEFMCTTMKLLYHQGHIAGIVKAVSLLLTTNSF